MSGWHNRVPRARFAAPNKKEWEEKRTRHSSHTPGTAQQRMLPRGSLAGRGCWQVHRAGHNSGTAFYPLLQQGCAPLPSNHSRETTHHTLKPMLNPCIIC